jgi:1-acyl-sn-glycerol-3-phosphate acyltransferase
MSGYAAFQVFFRRTLPLLGKVTVQGLHNVPRSGPFLVLANHQSVLDPFIVQAYCPRPLHTMAKSTQFGAPIVRGLMTWAFVFPVRRFQTDPQSVRIVLRRLREQQGVAIYIEGERSWNGRIQQPRRGTVRLALKAGVPIIPCTVDGTYDVWPRWDRGVRRAPIRLTIGEPIHLPKLDSRAERDAALEETANTIMDAIQRPLASHAAANSR